MAQPADAIKPQVYRDSRPAEALRPYHDWARTHEPGWTYTAVRVLLTPVALLLSPRGPGRDPWLLGVRGRRRGRFPRITVSYGVPVALERNPDPSREEQIAASERIFDRVRDLYHALER